MLPGMKLGLDRTTGLKRILKSWKSKDDPGTGNCWYMLNTNVSSPELFLYKDKGNVKWWRSGHWNGFGWSGIPTLSGPNSLYNFSPVNNQTETTISYVLLPEGSIFQRFVVNESGSIESIMADLRRWTPLGSAPLDQCDNYGKCGAYGKCVNVTEFECTCHKANGLREMRQIDSNMSLKECQQRCLENCNCTAYGGVDVKEEAGCMRWYGDLMDTRVLKEGQNLYVRVDAVELVTKECNKCALMLAQLGPKLKQTTGWIEETPIEL
uniref:Apple domain-containing protein n=1 Tax=Fagus sylvatica TaxID=28930 RepID=A0A2N9HGR5_FAGSY